MALSPFCVPELLIFIRVSDYIDSPATVWAYFLTIDVFLKFRTIAKDNLVATLFAIELLGRGGEKDRERMREKEWQKEGKEDGKILVW